MTILSGRSILDYPGLFILPHVGQKMKHDSGLSYGLSEAGYDIRLSGHESSNGVLRSQEFRLCSSLEKIYMPNDLLCIVHDKSSNARNGIAVQNTVLEPGWYGHITLELTNHSEFSIIIEVGMPIAQLIFHKLDQPADSYKGMYQNQADRPVDAFND